MLGINYVFDASQYSPEQSVGAHPIGKFRAQIANTELKPIKDDASGRPRFVVKFQTEAGTIDFGYNLWSESLKAVEISHKQLSALCHATGIFKVNMSTAGAELKGAWCMIEVGKQKETEYVEVKKVFDVNGNEPGKPQTQQQQPTQNAFAPQTQQAPQTANGFAPPAQQPQQAQQWGNAPQPTQQAPQQAPAQNAWGAPTPAAAQSMQATQQSFAPQQAQEPWQQGQAPAGEKPAWAR